MRLYVSSSLKGLQTCLYVYLTILDVSEWPYCHVASMKPVKEQEDSSMKAQEDALVGNIAVESNVSFTVPFKIFKLIIYI